jgi:dTMP kinase
MDIDFHHRIRTGFLAIANREPERCAVIDAAIDPADVHERVIQTINSRLGLALKAAHG